MEPEKQETKHDVKVMISNCLPSLYTLIGERDFSWPKLNEMFNEKLNDILQKAKNGADKHEVSIHEILLMYSFIINKHSSLIDTNTKNGSTKEDTLKQILNLCDEREKKHLGSAILFDRLFDALNSLLDDKEKELIRGALFSILVSHDSKYINFVGEMVALSQLKNEGYKLIDVEFELNNTKPIDFKVIEPGSNKEYNIEVVNYKLISEKIGENADITKFFEKRFADKFSSKLLDNKQPINFYLLPILWTDIKGLRKLQNYYKSPDAYSRDEVLEPCAYIMRYTDDNFDQQFGLISTLNLED